MKTYLYGFLLGVWGAIGFAPQGPALWARAPNGSDVVELGGLKSRVPADWAEHVPNYSHYFKQFRLEPVKQYRLEPINDDKDDAHVAVYSPAKGEVVTAAEHVKRWKEVFLPPLGQTMDQAAKVREFTVSGARVTLLDVHGDYKGLPGNPATPRPNYRLLGVYFDTPQGAYVIRLFGPADTVGFYRNEFEDWVKAFK